ncbi:hypothetical protein ACFQY7_18780 [Actinomadura luteofluorescens]
MPLLGFGESTCSAALISRSTVKPSRPAATALRISRFVSSSC